MSHIPGVLPAADVVGLGHPLLDRYVVFVASRARANTVAATVSDLRVFFSVVDKDPRLVTASDVLDFVATQRRPRRVRWCDWPMVRPGCRRRRSSVGCRACRGCSRGC